jgi:hypothetical protein
VRRKNAAVVELSACDNDSAVKDFGGSEDQACGTRARVAATPHSFEQLARIRHA